MRILNIDFHQSIYLGGGDERVRQPGRPPGGERLRQVQAGGGRREGSRRPQQPLVRD
jgi:hypothetical protein